MKTEKKLRRTGILLSFLLAGFVFTLAFFAENAKAASTPKVIFFGDSITHGTNGAKKTDGFSPVKRPFPSLVGELLSVKTTNMGVGSMGWIGRIKQTAYQKIKSTDLTPYDYIVIAMGVNDEEKKLGTWDSMDEATVMGQFNKTMDYLVGQGLGEKVIIVAPWKTVKTNRAKMSAVMKQASEHYGIPYITQDDCPITAGNIGDALPDGVHPDQKHYEMIAEWLAAKIQPLIGRKWAKRVSWVTLSESTCLYTGEALEPEAKVFGADGGHFVELDPGDYSLVYQNNTEAGTAKVTATGKNGYASKATAEFEIKKAEITGAELKYSSLHYTGKALKQNSTTKVISGNKVLTEGEDYTITYKNNVKVGKATMTIKGKGRYTGTITKTFSIVPAKTTLSWVTSSVSGKIKVRWQAHAAQTTGYQIQYSTRSDFSTDSKKIKSAGASKYLRTISGLKGGKVYYVRIRTYKTVGSKTYYSDWSGTRMVTVRK